VSRTIVAFAQERIAVTTVRARKEVINPMSKFYEFGWFASSLTGKVQDP
jgi:hypothetical protein